MTAAVSLGSSVQSMGTAAAAALPNVTAGGLQAAAATALPQTVGSATAATSQLATNLGVVEKPARAFAAAAPRLTTLQRTVGFLSKALPIVTIGASALSGAQIVNEHGADALVNTKQGRGAVLGALGGALMLVPHPATQVAAAGVLGAVAANHFGGLDRLNGKPPPFPTSLATTTTHGAVPAADQAQAPASAPTP